MVKHGKRYNNASSQVVEDTDYEPADAVALVKNLATAKFDETIELHLRTGADPRHADQTIRGVAILPHGVGKPIRTLVFTQGEAMGLAEEAGADYVGNDDYIKQIEDGWLEFDVSIATPDMMGKIGRLGRILGRKGLEDSKKGRVEYRLDRSGLMHMPIGKASFDADQLLDNLTMLMDNIVRARPSGVKGHFIRAAYLSSTMGPSVSMDVAMASELRVE